MMWLMKLGSVPLRPLWPGSMPTVIPASGLAAAVGAGLGVGEAVAGSGDRRAAGEATESPAALVPLVTGCWLPHAASRQARAAGQATAGSNRHRLARSVGPGERPPGTPDGSRPRGRAASAVLARVANPPEPPGAIPVTVWLALLSR